MSIKGATLPRFSTPSIIGLRGILTILAATVTGVAAAVFYKNVLLPPRQVDRAYEWIKDLPIENSHKFFCFGVVCSMPFDVAQNILNLAPEHQQVLCEAFDIPNLIDITRFVVKHARYKTAKITDLGDQLICPDGKPDAGTEQFQLGVGNAIKIASTVNTLSQIENLSSYSCQAITIAFQSFGSCADTPDARDLEARIMLIQSLVGKLNGDAQKKLAFAINNLENYFVIKPDPDNVKTMISFLQRLDSIPKEDQNQFSKWFEDQTRKNGHFPSINEINTWSSSSSRTPIDPLESSTASATSEDSSTNQ